MWNDGEIVWDQEQGRPGRGAYLHPELQCLSRLANPRLWERALRVPKGVIGAEKLQELRRTLEGLIGDEDRSAELPAQRRRLRL